MGKRYVLVDDYSGDELPEDTSPVRLSLGRKAYNLYLSDKSLEALYSALEPFVKDAETDTGKASPNQKSSDRERIKAIRTWAQNKNIKHNGKPLGDRGRIPQEIVDAYDKEN